MLDITYLKSIPEEESVYLKAAKSVKSHERRIKDPLPAFKTE
jgi:hypothetical protein